MGFLYLDNNLASSINHMNSMVRLVLCASSKVYLWQQAQSLRVVSNIKAVATDYMPAAG